MQATEAQLRTALVKAGFLWELSMPKGPDGRFKGYAFATYTLRAHAERAIALVNGEVSGLTFVWDLHTVALASHF